MTLSTHHYEDFFRHAPGLLCIVDADGGVRAVSAACEELFDLPSGGGGSLFELTHTDDAEPLRGSLAQAGAGPTSLRELRLRCKGGAYRRFRWNVRAQPGGGALFGVLTEQDQGSLEARRFRFLAEAVTDFIGIGEFSGRTVYMNPSGCKMLGYTLEEALQCDILQFVPPHHQGSHDRGRRSPRIAAPRAEARVRVVNAHRGAHGAFQSRQRRARRMVDPGRT